MNERTVTLIAQTKFIELVERQPLKVVAYCRVSKNTKEQLSSLEHQIQHYSQFIKSKLNWVFAGIYSDVKSGLNTKNRIGYKKLMQDCKKKKIDSIIVKSLSRFGRDALEIIKQIRRLRKMGIGIYVEIGGINTMTSGKLIFEILAAQAQEESRMKSENTKFGIKQSVRNGNVKLNYSQFLGYTKGKNGKLIIVPEEAEVVKKIFELYLEGNGCRKIKKYLESNNIKTVTGKSEWSTSTIDRMLSSEKYIGNILYQKSYTANFLKGKQVKNNGEIEQIFIENNHEPIIDLGTFYKVQEMKNKSVSFDDNQESTTVSMNM